MPDPTHPSGKAPPEDSGQLIDFPREHGSRPPPKNNLPLQLTSFVGREREIAELRGVLADSTRLLTLTGAGGSGKTRLALVLATEMVDCFEDGVWWVELAPLSEPDLVPQAVASAVGVREAPGRPANEVLRAHLETNDLLLVLDNCEHLIDACAALADALLRTCPGLKILATSREPLGIAGETIWLVPPLSLPEVWDLSPVERLVRYEAISLFVERAKAVAPTFELTQHNAPYVARVCQRLDGIPLAIELAAARTRVLSAAQISSRLDESLRLLGTKSRKADSRQQTLRATIGWSHGLLSGQEQTLFRRLSVFSGGFTLEAVEAVCDEDGIEQEDVLDLLSRLVDKSLVLVAEQDDEARYRLLETVGQYGREKLDESGEEPSLRRRHAYFFLKLAERVEPKINSKDRGPWLGRSDAEHDNLRAALAWSREEVDSEVGLRLAGALQYRPTSLLPHPQDPTLRTSPLSITPIPMAPGIFT